MWRFGSARESRHTRQRTIVKTTRYILGAAAIAAASSPFDSPFDSASVAASFGALPGAFMFAEAADIDALRARLVSLNAQAQGVAAAADEDGRDLSDEEATRLAGIQARFDATEAQIAMLERNEAAGSPETPRHAVRASAGALRPRQVNAELGGEPGQAIAGAVNPRLGIILDRASRRPPSQVLGVTNARDEWANADEFFAAAISGARDPRLFKNLVGSEGVGQDGGFAVPTTWFGGVIDLALQQAEFAPRCRVFPSQSNTVIVPMPDVENRSSDIAGLNGTWAVEGGTQTSQRLRWRGVTLKLSKIFILAEASSELLEDIPGIAGNGYSGQLTGMMATASAYSLDSAILKGTGVGMPLGILMSASTIVVAEESGQTADTLVYQNLVKMYSRLMPASQKRGTWYISSDVLPQLLTMVFPGSTNPVLLNVFSGSAIGAVSMSIFGRPVVVDEVMSQLGTLGDIVFADMSQYALAMKTSARLEMSNAPGFASDVMAWRLIMRVTGQPLWDKPITQYNGSSATLSWAATLATRA